ncbi:outer membrane lipoprotein-sorting protein [Thalassotalea ponticola]|uniref:outer membrane lipoprotein-sorting protein n=1 Tax=Thalassotalea ponticola TaxID=1523392 RepID=UPI0025B425C3|nr:outer membrane lipoprotein-sorting protein [Thalassotalea ponticola]MDN3651823.1 outer membrane lipoprotein-sorting protein [Thalassotalea ponticola]
MKDILKNTVLLSAFVYFSATAQTMPVEQIIDKANLVSYYAADDGTTEARMMIVDQNGNKQMRQFRIYRKDISDRGAQKMLVVFSRPTDVKGTVFRVEKHVESDDNRWLYLPALDLVKRISAGDKRTSFVGSHFYYEDVSGRNPNDDTYELIATDESYYQIKGTPKDAGSVEFAYYQVKIDNSTFLPMEMIYFDQQGKAMRKMTVKKVAVIDGHPTVMHSRIEQLADGSYTEMQFRNVRYDQGLDDSLFSDRSYRNPPSQ